LKTFEVRLYELIYHTVQVEADSVDDACDKASRVVTGEVKGKYETDSNGFTGDYRVEVL